MKMPSRPQPPPSYFVKEGSSKRVYKEAEAVKHVPSYSLELVRWTDSRGVSPDWEWLDADIVAEAQTCCSVGWITHETEEVIVVVPHIALPCSDTDLEQGCGDMTIPKVCIASREELSSD